MREVFLLKGHGSNNAGEICGYEDALAAKLVKMEFARWPTDEEVNEILSAHHEHKADLAAQAAGSKAPASARHIRTVAQHEDAKKVTKPAAEKVAKPDPDQKPEKK